MFKKKLRTEFEFEFYKNSTLIKNSPKDYDYYLFIAYEEDLIKFFKLNKKGASVIVSLFNKQIPESLSFLKEIKNLILLDPSKTKNEIFKELILYFKNTPNSQSRIQKTCLSNSYILQTQFRDSYKNSVFL